jgi:hypothetical protein
VDANTVKLRAAGLELPFPRQGKRQTTRSKRVISSSQNGIAAPSNAKVDAYRTEWLAALALHPEAGRTFLRKHFQRVYTWLRRNDREWLLANLPQRLTKVLPPPRVNWEERDLDLAAKVELASLNLLKQPGEPIQITIAAIARELGQLALLQQHLDKLPLTAAVLDKIIETREAFALRRIRWVVDCYQEEGVCPKKWELVRRAGLRPELAKVPQIEQAITSAIDRLNVAMNHYGWSEFEEMALCKG